MKNCEIQPLFIVDKILATKTADPKADTRRLRRRQRIDTMVYGVYGLEPQEIEVVEGKG